MNNLTYIQEKFGQLEQNNEDSLSETRREAFDIFNRVGIPTTRNEEWKYTRIGSLFNKEFQLQSQTELLSSDIDAVRLPAHEEANELVFINGVYSADFSIIRSNGLTVQSLEEAAGNEFESIVKTHFNHSSSYLPDGIHALNTAFIKGGVFAYVHHKHAVEHPIYIYNITDARNTPVLSQPRSLIYVSEQAQVQIVETYITIGVAENLTNQVTEMVIAKDAIVDYYKIQNDTNASSQVSTTHVQQIGKSLVNTITISLNGGIVRNNLHAVMQAEYAEAHLYGLYFQRGQSHVDNHTIVDNAVPNCFSNELYKGILDEQSTSVFNGKIFVRKDAQKTNAFQSNKNVLLSETANVNTKPQLEIYADDVKCSHGCTVGSLDKEALFYLQSRGIPAKEAMHLLLQGFAMDVLDKIKLAPIRTYVETLIAERLTLETA